MNWATRIVQAYTEWLQAANGGSPEERREALRDLHEVTGQALQDTDPELEDYIEHGTASSTDNGEWDVRMEDSRELDDPIRDGEFLSSDLRLEGKPMAAEDYKRTCTREVR